MPTCEHEGTFSTNIKCYEAIVRLSYLSFKQLITKPRVTMLLYTLILIIIYISLLVLTF